LQEKYFVKRIEFVAKVTNCLTNIFSKTLGKTNIFGIFWKNKYIRENFRKNLPKSFIFTQRSSVGCSAAQCWVQRSSVLGCSAAQWLVRWAAVRQPRVRFPPGTPPSAQQDELFTQTQEFIPSSGRYPAGEDLPEDEYCINVCLVRKNTK
jgi:hypothetical protein